MCFKLDWKKIDILIDQALKEDLGTGDLTAEFFVDPKKSATAEIVAKERCCLAGLPIAEKVFVHISKDIQVIWNYKDGDDVESGQVGLVKGPAHAILTGERTALNFLQHLSGICSHTASVLREVQGFSVDICDTRKTIPGWRHLAKYAVSLGGGKLHRWGLDDAVLVKQNHFRLMGSDINLQEKIKSFKSSHPGKLMIIEVNNEADIEGFVQSGADILLLDNFSPETVKKVVEKWKNKVIFEASGKIDLDNVLHYAKSGVERISIGALTHSVRAIDLSLQIT